MDDQKKKQIIMVAVLGAVLAGVLFYQLVLAGPPTPGSVPGGDNKKETAADTSTPTTTTSRSASRGGSSGNLLETTEIDIEELTQSVEVQPIDYSAVRIGRNPMAPLVGGVNEQQFIPEGEDKKIVVTKRQREVTGIIWDEVNPVAIIDNMVVPEGYVFEDGVVVQVIEPTRVLLKVGEQLLPLEMKEF